MQRKAWLFGAPAPGVDADVARWRQTLTGDLDPEHRFQLTDDAVITGTRATSRALDAMLDDITGVCQGERLALWWIAAHGIHADGVNYIVAADASMHDARENPRAEPGAVPVCELLYRIQHRFRADSVRGRLILILDICHAGHPEPPRLPAQVVVLGASGAGEVARANADGGFLTDAITSALGGEFLRPEDGFVTLGHLALALRVATQKRKNLHQRPWWLNLDPNEDANIDLRLNRLDPRAHAPGPDACLGAWRAHTLRAHEHLVQFFRRRDDIELLDSVYTDLDVRPPGGDRREDEPDRGLTLRRLIERDPARRWAVLGAPGAGKSTLARHLAWVLAAEQDGPIPALVSLPRWAGRGTPLDAAERALADARSRRGEDIGDAAGLAASLATTSRPVWVLLDGLDELGPDAARETRTAIEAFAEAHPRITVVVLSRPIGYTALSGFDVARVQALTDPQQEDLLVAWLDEPGERTRGRRAHERIRALPALAEAAQKPLLLSLIAMLAREHPERALPADRGELYRLTIDLLLGRGHDLEPRGLPVDEQKAARRVFAALSLRLTEAPGEAWSDDTLVDLLGEVCDARPPLARLVREGWRTGARCLQALSRQTGLLGPHGDVSGPWRYLHRSLRERLAAEALLAEGAEGIVARIRAIADDRELLGRWGETLGMACALLDDPSAPLAALREADAALTVRVLPELTGLPLDVALDALWGIDIGGGRSSDHAFDGETLYAIARTRPVGDAAARLTARVTPDIDLDRLAFIHHALDRLGCPPERAPFFAAAGRPVDDMPAIELCDIPGGDFWMGSPDDEPGRDDDEGPRVQVRLATFAMARDPVTVEQYQRFDPRHECPGGPRHPVTEVSWWRAGLFAAWSGSRLPTEAEWEYACRGGTSTRYWSGDSERDLARVGWFGGHAGAGSHPVDERPDDAAPEHPRGLRGMHGNVYEWCRDWYAPYPEAAAGAPLPAPLGPPQGANRVVRGGSWDAFARWCRSAVRFRGPPGDRVGVVGFRLVRAPRAPWP